MSKRFKGKTCPYCARAGVSTAPDHVFAREFFPKDKRNNLPQVPACDACNGDKSTLEHYLTAVLPFGGRHADSGHVLAVMAPPRLEKNRKLRGDLARGVTDRLEDVGGLMVPTMAVPFDIGKLERLCGLIARGLALFHFGAVIPADCHVHAGAVTPDGERALTDTLLSLHGNRVIKSIGDSAFEYEGLQSIAGPHLTVWRFKIYGGIQLTGDPQAPDVLANTVWVTTSKSAGLGELFGRPVSCHVAPLTEDGNGGVPNG